MWQCHTIDALSLLVSGIRRAITGGSAVMYDDDINHMEKIVKKSTAKAIGILASE